MHFLRSNCKILLTYPKTPEIDFIRRENIEDFHLSSLYFARCVKSFECNQECSLNAMFYRKLTTNI